MRVVVQANGDFLVNALSAAPVATADAGVVEGRVVRAKVASTAVPQRRHCSMGWNDMGNSGYSPSEDREADVQRGHESV